MCRASYKFRGVVTLFRFGSSRVSLELKRQHYDNGRLTKLEHVDKHPYHQSGVYSRCPLQKLRWPTVLMQIFTREPRHYEKGRS